MTKNFIYKIRRISDGLFSTGGQYPRFNKNGKAWTDIGHLKNHLNQFSSERIRTFYGDCELIAYVQEPIKGIPMNNIIFSGERNEILNEWFG